MFRRFDVSSSRFIRKHVVPCALCLLAAIPARGQVVGEPLPPLRPMAPAAEARVPQKPSRSLALPKPTALAPAAQPAKADHGQALHHLHRATEHLVAAGRKDLAEKIMREAERTEQLALLARKKQEVKQLEAEIARLTQQTQQSTNQVLLHVKVMEVSLDKLKARGVKVDQLFRDRQPVPAGRKVSAQSDAFWYHVAGQPELLDSLEALRRANVVKVLAEPTLITVSGRPASFRSGGEFPIIVPQSEGKVGIEYREFGTRVDCVPLILNNGNIRLELRPTVSEIDANRSIQVNDVTVPSLRTRTIDTAAELKPGQTIVLVGPADHNGQGEERTALVVTARAEIGATRR